MVYFVGAGPGAADLITVRGLRLLEKADVVIYAGSLVNRELLEYCRKDCRIYDSSKMELGGILEVMRKAHEQGLMTVRLASGDPSIYGALHEMGAALEDMGIGYEVCPGVSSFLAASAALKREYMIPGLSQSLVITRVGGRTQVPESEGLSVYAATGCSLAIFLSTSLLESVRDELLAGGYKEEDKAALVYRVSREDERVIYCSIGELPERARGEGIFNTALVIAGPVLSDARGRSKLYDAHFETLFRSATDQVDGDGRNLFSES